MERRRFNAEFKREAVKLTTQRELESSGGAGTGAREATGLRTYWTQPALTSWKGKFKAS